jgi:hypothetical protein
MKIAAVLFMYYIASTEQLAAGSDRGVNGVYTYPSRSWKEMERKAQQGMEEFKMKAEASFSQNAQAGQTDIPTDQGELQRFAHQDYPKREK